MPPPSTAAGPACAASPPARATRSSLAPHLAETLSLDEEGVAQRYGASAVRRAGRIGLARHAAVVLGNSGNPEALPLLSSALVGHDSALVRGHAAWAIGRLAPAVGRAARDALERARRDPDPTVHAEVAAALASQETVG
jgi:epoxyqueuosine reductase